MKKLPLAKKLAFILVLGLLQACSTTTPQPEAPVAEPVPQATAPAPAPVEEVKKPKVGKKKCPIEAQGKMSKEMRDLHAKKCAKAKSHKHCTKTAHGAKCPHMTNHIQGDAGKAEQKSQDQAD